MVSFRAVKERGKLGVDDIIASKFSYEANIYDKTIIILVTCKSINSYEYCHNTGVAHFFVDFKYKSVA